MLKRELSEGARKYTVLVVEDEILLRYVVCEFLRMEGFVVVEATNADEALSYVRVHPEIDLVFTDVRMPGEIDGLNLVRQLSEAYSELRFIVASGDRLPGPDVKVPFFRKPYDLDRLLANIVEQLNIGSLPGAADGQ